MMVFTLLISDEQAHTLPGQRLAAGISSRFIGFCTTLKNHIDNYTFFLPQKRGVDLLQRENGQKVTCCLRISRMNFYHSLIRTASSIVLVTSNCCWISAHVTRAAPSPVNKNKTDSWKQMYITEYITSGKVAEGSRPFPDAAED